MSIFLTGFPGFLGGALLPRLAAARHGHELICLVQAKFAPLARAKLEALVTTMPGLRRRLRLVEGDITTPGLGIDRAVAASVTEVWHLAAIYDLAIPRGPAARVNVDGTRNVLDFSETVPALERLHYVSTCYVSGKYDGVFFEDDLEKGQRFNNFYEETKYLAELEVRSRMARGLPCTIYRPSIVVGDSATGETQKYDGPYYAIRWILRQPRLAVMPIVGDPHAHTINVVPRDWLIDAIAHIAVAAGTEGRTFQLADPDPPRIAEVLDLVERFAGRRILRVPIPVSVAKGSLRHVPGLERLMGIPPEAVDYFVHPTRYDTTSSRAILEPAGLAAPPFRDYIANLVQFVRNNPSVPSGAMA